MNIISFLFSLFSINLFDATWCDTLFLQYGILFYLLSCCEKFPDANIYIITIACKHHNAHLSLKDVEGEGDSGVDSSSPEIMEALRRERQLKVRVQDLVTTLEKVTKNSEARHMQSQEFINDLKKANGWEISWDFMSSPILFGCYYY